MKPAEIHIAAELKSCSFEILNNRDKLEQIIHEAITKSKMTMMRVTSHKFNPVGVTVTAVISESHVAIHTHPEAEHASLDIYTCTYNPDPPRELFEYLKKELKAKDIKYIELFRGDVIDKKDASLLTTAAGSGFEIRYQIDTVIYSKKTEFQQLDIFENFIFGKMLFLDKDLQIADSDAHIYNEAMVAPCKKHKDLRNILILGGGDGGVANKLLKETNCEITLVDIDPEVIEASKTYLPKIAGNAFDDKRVNVVNQDVENFLSDNRGYDAILYDLSMHPELFSIKDRNTYLKDLFKSLKKALNDEGILSMQCCSAFDFETLNMIREILPLYFNRPINFNEVFIPSFCEKWVFASINL